MKRRVGGSSSEQDRYEKTLADEAPSDVSSSEQVGAKKARGAAGGRKSTAADDEAPIDVSAADQASKKEALASDAPGGGEPSESADSGESKAGEPAKSADSAENKPDVAVEGESGEEDSGGPAGSVVAEADSGSVVVSVGVPMPPSERRPGFGRGSFGGVLRSFFGGGGRLPAGMMRDLWRMIRLGVTRNTIPRGLRGRERWIQGRLPKRRERFTPTKRKR